MGLEFHLKRCLAITIGKQRSPLLPGRNREISRADERHSAFPVQWRTSGAPFGTESSRTMVITGTKGGTP